MSKRWMGIVVLLALFAVPATYAAESASSNPVVQIFRQIVNRISAMIPPTGNEEAPPQAPGSSP